MPCQCTIDFINACGMTLYCVCKVINLSCMTSNISSISCYITCISRNLGCTCYIFQYNTIVRCIGNSIISATITSHISFNCTCNQSSIFYFIRNSVDGKFIKFSLRTNACNNSRTYIYTKAIIVTACKS